MHPLLTLNIITPNAGALIIRMGFWDVLYYTYHKEPVLVIAEASIVGLKLVRLPDKPGIHSYLAGGG